MRRSKAIKAKERATLVLAVNATGTHKIPVALNGRAKQPLCFRTAGCVSPLPYFHQRNSWMDGEVFKKWLETVFLAAVRARTIEKVALIVENLASHKAVEDEQLLFITLPPNTTAVFQPLDAGVIECLKRRHKRRFLEGLIRSHTSSVRTPAVSAAGARARSSLLSNGRANLLDVARIIREEWACITAESIVRCWLKADCLPASSAAPLRAQHADYHNATTPPVAAIVDEITTLLRGTTLGSRLFPGTAVSGLPQGVLGWLCAETDPHVVEDTVDLALGQDNEEYREEEE